ncbi:hypothetical protein L6452_20149 [Arctium lappa]|uniref:Uncharacterized protein n=1 Tax=Arctium lappa TaxID=4217 RepID=A0ACB9BA32_ARCLA|nr:hypothetical protein L6452_20149 [Arctium lappa]
MSYFVKCRVNYETINFYRTSGSPEVLSQSFVERSSSRFLNLDLKSEPQPPRFALGFTINNQNSAKASKHHCLRIIRQKSLFVTIEISTHSFYISLLPFGFIVSDAEERDFKLLMRK